jgi:hypothetical protein
MNERIRELAEESYNEFYNVHIDLELFAELIVQECASVLRAESERLYKLSAEEKDELFASNFEICAEKCWDNEVMIKEHFGVKE